MLDEQLRSYGRELKDAVTVPDLRVIEERGRSVRRRRRLIGATAVASLVVAGLAVTTGLSVIGDVMRSEEPASERKEDVTPLPIEVQPPELEPGTYETPLWRESDIDRYALVTVPWRWGTGPGPWRRFPGGGTVEVVVVDVDEVATEPCASPSAGMEPVGNSPAALVDALVDLPGHPVVAGPEDVRKFGLDAVHLTLEGGAVQCPVGQSMQLWGGAGHWFQTTLGAGARFDLWVVDLDGEAVLVGALASEEPPDRVTSELFEVVDSVRFSG